MSSKTKLAFPFILLLLLGSTAMAASVPDGYTRLESNYGISLLSPAGWLGETDPTADSPDQFTLFALHGEHPEDTLTLLFLKAGTDERTSFSMSERAFEQWRPSYGNLLRDMHLWELESLGGDQPGRLSLELDELERREVNGKKLIIYALTVAGFDDPNRLFRIYGAFALHEKHMAVMRLTFYQERGKSWTGPEGARLDPQTIINSLTLTKGSEQLPELSDLETVPLDWDAVPFKRAQPLPGLWLDIPEGWSKIDTGDAAKVLYMDLEGDSFETLNVSGSPRGTAEVREFLLTSDAGRREELKRSLTERLQKKARDDGAGEVGLLEFEAADTGGYAALRLIFTLSGESRLSSYILPVGGGGIYIVFNTGPNYERLTTKATSGLALDNELAAGAIPADKIGSGYAKNGYNPIEAGECSVEFLPMP